MKPKEKKSAHQVKENSKSEHQSTAVHQVRGEDLRKKMEQSEDFGSKYRAEHQGSDVLKDDIKHNETPKKTKDPIEFRRSFPQQNK